MRLKFSLLGCEVFAVEFGCQPALGDLLTELGIDPRESSADAPEAINATYGGQFERDPSPLSTDDRFDWVVPEETRFGFGTVFPRSSRQKPIEEPPVRPD